jgi:hypothetical protein
MTWQTAFRSLKKKTKAIEAQGMCLLQSISPYIDRRTGYVEIFLQSSLQ